MPKVKKIPQRQCVGCREMKDKKSLLRVVKSPEGEVSLAAEGGSPGVDSIISGITTMMTGKTSPLPYLVFSGKHVKINLAKIPQLSKLFYVVSSPSLTATANGLKITVNI